MKEPPASIVRRNEERLEDEAERALPGPGCLFPEMVTSRATRQNPTRNAK